MNAPFQRRLNGFSVLDIRFAQLFDSKLVVFSTANAGADIVILSI